MQMTPVGWAPFVAALFVAGFFLHLKIKAVLPAQLCGIVAIGALLRWAWDLDPGPSRPPVDIGGGLRVPVYASGPSSHSWWATVILLLVAGALFGCLLFSYLYLWTVSPQVWPSDLPPLEYPIAAAVLLVLSSVAVVFANHRIYTGLIVAIALLGAAFAIELYAHRALEPTASSYGALIYAFVGLQGF
jgi:hypothetical protein